VIDGINDWGQNYPEQVSSGVDDRALDICGFGSQPLPACVLIFKGRKVYYNKNNSVVFYLKYRFSLNYTTVPPVHYNDNATSCFVVKL